MQIPVPRGEKKSFLARAPWDCFAKPICKNYLHTSLKWCWYGAILQMIVICKLQMNFQILRSSGAGSSGVFSQKYEAANSQ